MVQFKISHWAVALPLNGLFFAVHVGWAAQTALKETNEHADGANNAFIQREAFLDHLVANMTVPELGERDIYPSLHFSVYDPIISHQE
jgi:hypothetical protein